MTQPVRGNRDAIQSARCKCGHGVDHHMVTAQGEYSWMGWFWVTFGVSYRPVRIKYKCRTCGEVLAITNDPELIRTHL